MKTIVCTSNLNQESPERFSEKKKRWEEDDRRRKKKKKKKEQSFIPPFFFVCYVLCCSSFNSRVLSVIHVAEVRKRSEDKGGHTRWLHTKKKKEKILSTITTNQLLLQHQRLQPPRAIVMMMRRSDMTVILPPPRVYYTSKVARKLSGRADGLLRCHSCDWHYRRKWLYQRWGKREYLIGHNKKKRKIRMNSQEEDRGAEEKKNGVAQVRDLNRRWHRTSV